MPDPLEPLRVLLNPWGESFSEEEQERARQALRRIARAQLTALGHPLDDIEFDAEDRASLYLIGLWKKMESLPPEKYHLKSGGLRVDMAREMRRDSTLSQERQLKRHLFRKVVRVLRGMTSDGLTRRVGGPWGQHTWVGDEIPLTRLRATWDTPRPGHLMQVARRRDLRDWIPGYLCSARAEEGRADASSITDEAWLSLDPPVHNQADAVSPVPEKTPGIGTLLPSQKARLDRVVADFLNSLSSEEQQVLESLAPVGFGEETGREAACSLVIPRSTYSDIKLRLLGKIRAITTSDGGGDAGAYIIRRIFGTDEP